MNKSIQNPLLIEQVTKEVESLKTGEDLYRFLMSRKENGYTSALLSKVMKRAHLPKVGLIPMLHAPKTLKIVPFPKRDENADIYNVVEALLPAKEGDESKRHWLNGVWVHEGNTTTCNGYSLLQIHNVRYTPEYPEFWPNTDGPTMCPPEMPTWKQVIPTNDPEFIGIYNTRELAELLDECHKIVKGPIEKSVHSIPMKFGDVYFSTEILGRIMKVVARLEKNVIIRCDPLEGPMIITGSNNPKHFIANVMPCRIDDEQHPYFASPNLP
ncbi:MAG: hypothetical protein BWK79_05365 [Beggiatoa sp. IS2]|nr:MAG: hypothetical protein BWK79_05365 [Beggiatoa sp. IS2]